MKYKAFSAIKRFGPLVLILILNLLLYVFVIGPKILELKPIPPDTYRDIAYGTRILNGESIFEDPTIKGEYIWYPPLNPLIMAGVSKITGISIFTLYSFSVFVVNFLIPILFFLLLSQLFGKRIAFFSTLLMVIMPWISTHFFSMALTSIHGVAVMLAVLLFFVHVYKKGMPLGLSIILGILMGLSLLHHSLSGLILYGGIFIYLLIDFLAYKKRDRLVSYLVTLIIPVIVWAPYWLPNLFRPKLNPTSITHLAIELIKPDFALFIPNEFLYPLTIIFMIFGIIYAIRRFHRFQNRFILIFLGILLIGQLAGYIRYFGERGPQWARPLYHFPSLIPHEFQWFFQLFILPMIVLGFWLIFQYVSKNRLNFIKYTLLIVFALAGIILFPQQFDKFFLAYSPGARNISPVSEWINENTPKDSTVLASNVILAYYDIQPYTGRHLMATMRPYMNYNVDVEKRFKDKDFILHSAEASSIKALAKLYSLDYLVIQNGDVSAARLSFFQKNFQQIYDDYLGAYIFQISP